ncbi:MAG TPA: hypothetical protein VL688_01075 [Verrucomicrobiae bacterium]|nr:hypothetical protein [Verrucomicrobiae bacterium]
MILTLLVILSAVMTGGLHAGSDTCPSAMVFNESTGGCRPAPGNAGLGTANTAVTGTSTADGLGDAGGTADMPEGGSGNGSLHTATGPALTGQDISQGNI